MSFQTRLGDVENALERQKKSIRNFVPKNPLIGVPGGKLPEGGDSNMNMASEEEDGGSSEDDEVTHELNSSDSSGQVDDAVVGQLDNSSDEEGDMPLSSEFV
tara:strand:+ start:171 stop:476 length:306 start_codon:yes stop_codon:yes gene_type:complete